MNILNTKCSIEFNSEFGKRVVVEVAFVQSGRLEIQRAQEWVRRRSEIWQNVRDLVRNSLTVAADAVSSQVHDQQAAILQRVIDAVKNVRATTFAGGDCCTLETALMAIVALLNEESKVMCKAEQDFRSIVESAIRDAFAMNADGLGVAIKRKAEASLDAVTGIPPSFKGRDIFMCSVYGDITLQSWIDFWAAPFKLRLDKEVQQNQSFISKLEGVATDTQRRGQELQTTVIGAAQGILVAALGNSSVRVSPETITAAVKAISEMLAAVTLDANHPQLRDAASRGGT